mmetsp:Transcript_25100/g.70512  ORF Transcript_25100/g.70512 Transcript_25100/m.70512 type:complete len:374 (-) Transcript_25100:492-1613(-)
MRVADRGLRIKRRRCGGRNSGCSGRRGVARRRVGRESDGRPAAASARNAPGARDATPRRLRVGPAGGGPRVVDVVGGLRANARVRVPPARRVRDGTRGRGRRDCRTAEPPPERAPPQALAAPRFAGERRQRLPNYRLGRRRRRCHLDGDAAPGAGTRGGHARRRRAPDLRGARTVQHRRRRSDARRRPRVVPVAPRVARAVRDRAILVPPPGLRLVGQHGARPRGGRGRGRLRIIAVWLAAGVLVAVDILRYRVDALRVGAELGVGLGAGGLRGARGRRVSPRSRGADDAPAARPPGGASRRAASVAGRHAGRVRPVPRSLGARAAGGERERRRGGRGGGADGGARGGGRRCARPGRFPCRRRAIAPRHRLLV